MPKCPRNSVRLEQDGTLEYLAPGPGMQCEFVEAPETYRPRRQYGLLAQGLRSGVHKGMAELLPNRALSDLL